MTLYDVVLLGTFVRFTFFGKCFGIGHVKGLVRVDVTASSIPSVALRPH